MASNPFWKQFLRFMDPFGIWHKAINLWDTAEDIIGTTSGSSSGGSGVLGALSSVGKNNNFWSALTNRLSAEHMTGADREAADLSYQQQEKFFNDYQSIPAQVQQSVEAGLNPALMYGRGATPMSPISGNASASAPSLDPAAILSFMADVAFRSKEVRAETRLKSAQSKLLSAQAIGQENENSVFADKFDFWKQTQMANLDNINADIFLKNAQGALAEQGISESEARTTLLHYQGITEKSNSEFADRLNKSLLDIRESAIELNKAQAEFASSQSAESKQRLTEAQQSWGSRWRAIQENLKSLENENAAFWTDKRVNELIALSEIFSNYKKQFKIGPFGGEEIDWQRIFDKNGPSMYSPLSE